MIQKEEGKKRKTTEGKKEKERKHERKKKTTKMMMMMKLGEKRGEGEQDEWILDPPFISPISFFFIQSTGGAVGCGPPWVR